MKRNVYFAVASYKEPTRRIGENALSVRSFFLDIDVGEQKPYLSKATAVTALEDAVKTIGLPSPFLVDSGYGVHAYWPMERDIPAEDWASLAKRFKLLMKPLISYDPARTSDVASIMRVVGSSNYKDPSNPRLVGFKDWVEPYSNELFYSKLPLTELKKKVYKAGDNQSNTPSDPEKVKLCCAQIKRMVDLGGLMPEPDWFACLGVLAFCENGRDRAHEWSGGDPRYDYEETERKLQAKSELTGPTTCEMFRSLNDVCSGCPFSGMIKTPVELGRDFLGITKEQLEPRHTSDKNVDMPEIGAFKHVKGVLVHRSKDKSGEDIFTKVTQYPVVVTAVLKSEHGSDSYSVNLMHKPPLEDWQSVIMPIKILFGSSGIAEIMGKGINIHNANLFRQYVRESMDYIVAKERAGVQFEQFGWKNDDTQFLIGEVLYTADGPVHAPATSELSHRSRYLGPTKSGSVEQWSDYIDKLFAKGTEAQGFAVLASLSAPLMRFQSENEGGAILSLLSRKSGKGKTTALMGAASVWGRFELMKQVGADTRVAKGIDLGIMGNLPIMRDEYSDRDPESLKNEVQVFTEGRDKRRGTPGGGLVSLGARWQTVIIAGTNKSVVDTLLATKNGEAMAMRVMEFIVDLPPDVKHWQGESLVKGLDANSGHAGAIFMDNLVQPDNLNYVKSMLDTVRQDLIKQHSLTSDRRFIARLLAGAFVAGGMAKSLGIIDISVPRIIEWAKDTLFTKNPIVERPDDTAASVLGMFINSHIQNMLVVQNPFKPKTEQVMLREPTRSPLVIRAEKSTGTMFIDKKFFERWLQEQEYPVKSTVDQLIYDGVVESKNRLSTLSAGTSIISGQVPCIVVRFDAPALSGILKEVDIVKQTG